MSIPAFLDLIITKELFLPRIDKFDDPFEGHYPVIFWKNLFKHINEQEGKTILSTAWDNGSINKYHNELRRFAVASCWHMNTHQSDAMWRLYSERGVAIKSTTERLSSSIPYPPSIERVWVEFAPVEYVDYSRSKKIQGEETLPFYFKRTSFSHEREYRVVVYSAPDNPGGEPLDTIVSPFENGLRIPVNLDHVITKIVLSPLNPPWQLPLLQNLLSQYLPGKKIEQSTLYDMPN